MGNLWDRLGGGWAALVRGSGWRADREMFGLRGYVRVTEIVHQALVRFSPMCQGLGTPPTLGLLAHRLGPP